MGWWGHGIMEGDPPYDVRDGLVDALGFPDGDDDGPWDSDPELARRLLASRRTEWYLDAIRGSRDKDIAAFVVAYMHMAVGAPLDGRLRQEVERAGKGLSADAEHFTNPEERRTNVASFSQHVLAYDDKTPWQPVSKGLFEKIAEHMSGKGDAHGSGAPDRPSGA